MRFGILDRYFPDTGHAWRASHAELAAAGLDARTATEVVRAQQEIDPNAEMERLEQAGVTALAIGAPGDPSRLGEIDDAPPVLYVRGQWRPEEGADAGAHPRATAHRCGRTQERFGTLGCVRYARSS